MMSKLKISLVSAVLALSAATAVAIEPFETIVEAELSQVRLPAHEADAVRIKRCAECEPLKLKAAATTEYRIGGFDAPAISLKEFRAAIRKARDGDALIYVGYIEDSFAVTRIVVSASAD